MADPSAAVPPGWVVVPDPPEGATLVALEPEGPSTAGRFRGNVVVTSVSTGGLGFRDWQVGTEELLARVLADYQVIDLERLEVGGRRAGRRLAHHLHAEDGRALTMEQWFVLADGVGHTLTATVPTPRYAELADVVATAARAWLTGAAA